MAVMPFLCRGVWFSSKLSYHRIVSLAIYQVGQNTSGCIISVINGSKSSVRGSKYQNIGYTRIHTNKYNTYVTLVIINITKPIPCHSPQCHHRLFWHQSFVPSIFLINKKRWQSSLVPVWNIEFEKTEMNCQIHPKEVIVDIIVIIGDP